SAPPCLAAAMMAREHLLQTLPRFLSAAALRCLMLCHLLCPAKGFSSCNASGLLVLWCIHRRRFARRQRLARTLALARDGGRGRTTAGTFTGKGCDRRGRVVCRRSELVAGAVG